MGVLNERYDGEPDLPGRFRMSPAAPDGDTRRAHVVAAPRPETRHVPGNESARRRDYRRDGIAAHQPLRRSVLVARRLFTLALAPLLRSGVSLPDHWRPGRLPCRHDRPAMVRRQDLRVLPSNDRRDECRSPQTRVAPTGREDGRVGRCAARASTRGFPDACRGVLELSRRRDVSSYPS